MIKKLLFSVTKKDLKITYFSGTGKGGQHRNKHQNCVRLQHPVSGANVTGQSYKSRQANLKEAFNNLINDAKFRLWHNRIINEIYQAKTVDEMVDEMMKPENLVIETKDENGKWRIDKNNEFK